MNQISNISLPQTPSLIGKAGGAAPGNSSAGGVSFKEFMLESIDQVNEMQQSADQAVETLMTGGDVNPAEVLTAVQKADLAFRLTMQVRNKLMEVYQQVQDIRI